MALAIVFFVGVPTAVNAATLPAQKATDSPHNAENSIPNLVRSSTTKPTAEVATNMRATPMPRNSLRARAVDIDFSVLQTAFSEIVVEGTSRLMRIPFFDDATLLAEITHVAATSSGGQAYTGHVPGVPHS
ncbi:MAG: hypothetical protein LH481_14875, partial [Burkholderiales bacterium]|nr:hypothetical protein [Burkholderiales bacterium]